MTDFPTHRIDTWVFDLDNTLYPPAMRLFDQIEARMVAYIMRAAGTDAARANALRQEYWDRHGTTLAGLMAEHGVEPMGFLHDVHDIDFSVLTPDPELAQAITALPGRKIIYTNGDAHYAGRVLEARGLAGVFAEVYGVEHAGFVPKPKRAAFEKVFALDQLDPARAVMFEDEARNLIAPAEMGMATVHVAPERATGAHIQHHTSDLTAFLGAL